MNIPFSTRQYEILEFIQKNHHCHGLDVLNAPESKNRIQETQTLLQSLVACQAVKQLSPASDLLNSPLALTVSGAAALSAEKDRTQQATDDLAQKKAEKKMDRRFQLFNTLFGAVVGTAATLFVEHVLLPLF